MKSDLSKRIKSLNPNYKLKNSTSKRYCDKVKKDHSSDAIAQAKEDSHKKHLKIDCISKVI